MKICLQAAHSIKGELKTTLTLLSKPKHDKPSPPPNKQTHSHELQASSGNPGVLASTVHKHRASKRQREEETGRQIQRQREWTSGLHLQRSAAERAPRHLDTCSWVVWMLQRQAGSDPSQTGATTSPPSSTISWKPHTFSVSTHIYKNQVSPLPHHKQIPVTLSIHVWSQTRIRRQQQGGFLTCNRQSPCM